MRRLNLIVSSTRCRITEVICLWECLWGSFSIGLTETGISTTLFCFLTVGTLWPAASCPCQVPCHHTFPIIMDCIPQIVSQNKPLLTKVSSYWVLVCSNGKSLYTKFLLLLNYHCLVPYLLFYCYCKYTTEASEGKKHIECTNHHGKNDSRWWLSWCLKWGNKEECMLVHSSLGTQLTSFLLPAAHEIVLTTLRVSLSLQLYL